jgi:tetratricopeptide (TPR) repeat protein
MPESPIILTNIGLIKKHKGNWNEAIKFYKKSIDADPSYYEAYYNLGIAYYNIDRYEDAKIACQ